MPESTQRERRRDRWTAAAIFVALFAAYMANGEPLAGNDASSNVWLADLAVRGQLTFTPETTPSFFVWDYHDGDKIQHVSFFRWDDPVAGVPARELLARKAIDHPRPHYELVATDDPDVFADTFGLGAGLTAAPVFAVARLFAGDLAADNERMWQLGKLAAAAAVAGSAVCIFLVGLGFARRGTALALALTYGLCTCVWSTSSQALWQHGPNELFLALGLFWLFRRDRPHAPWLCGLFLSCAVACRPTSVIVVVAVGVWLIITDRRAALRFALAGLPVALALAWFGWRHFGNPLSFGQYQVGHDVAQAKTGSTALWQTSVLTGGAGLLFSPGRGLFMFSPVALFTVWGAAIVVRERNEWRPLLPILAATIVLFAMAAKWFDWWGGWCFGYRPIVDLMPLCALLAIPIVERLRRRRILVIAFAAAAAWSFGVQLLGAWSYDIVGWNARSVYIVTTPDGGRMKFETEAGARRFAGDHDGAVQPIALDIDKPAYRDRLWSFSDNPIAYYIEHAAQARANKLRITRQYLGGGD